MNLYGGLAEAETSAKAAGAVEIVADLRSDTVTRPDAAMRRAMAEAEVGDDVYGEDPSINRLDSQLAERLGKEAGLFASSGTQCNLCAVMSHCGRGDEALVGEFQHIYFDEAAGASVLGSVALWPLRQGLDGVIAPEAVTAAIKEDDPHFARTRLFCLENTFGGVALPLAPLRAASDAARAGGLGVHLDGARFFNAVAALGCAAHELADVADTVSICLSKGLGAPLGSVLVGDRERIGRARRIRKMLGGGMRQAGVAAAAGLHALERNIDRLADDHARAGRLAQALNALGAGEARLATNMVFYTPAPGAHTALRAHMAAAGVLIGAQEPEIRMVLHKDVDEAALGRIIEAFESFSAT